MKFEVRLMGFFRGLALVCAALLLPLNGASAQGTPSNSGGLLDGLNTQIVEMLGQERSVLRRVPSKRLVELASVSPNREKRGWFFGFRRRKGTGFFGSAPFRYSAASLARQPTARGGPQWRCLAQALYFEARGESVKGQFAVAEVILNRVDSRRFPNTVCRVIRQGAGNGRFTCQFTYMCDGKPETIYDQRAYQQVGKVARIMLDGAPRTLTDGATYYHSTSVYPSWAKKFTRTASIGFHIFYRNNRRISLN